MNDEGIDLVERSRVAEQLDALARRELARLVLFLAPIGSAAGAGLRPKGSEGVQTIFDRMCHGALSRLYRGIFFFSASIRFAFRNISA